jgi:probable rRNA maturation factor
VKRRRPTRAPAAPPAAPEREILIANRHSRLRVNRAAVARVIHLLDRNVAAIGVGRTALPQGELSLVFLTDPQLAELHATFMQDPSPTDVITFEGDAALGTAGEICVSADTALAYSRSTRGEFSAELTLYLVHGWLHLAGFDDRVPAKKRAMRRAEARAMRLLERSKAVPKFVLRALKHRK